jgi:hypothetical protein
MLMTRRSYRALPTPLVWCHYVGRAGVEAGASCCFRQLIDSRDGVFPPDLPEHVACEQLIQAMRSG